MWQIEKRLVSVENAIRRLISDFKRRQNIDAYVISTITAAFAILTVLQDIVPSRLNSAALLAGIALLVYRTTIPSRLSNVADEFLKDRSSFDETPFSSRIQNAREVWIFGPSAVNLLNPQNCDALRTSVLSSTDAVIRVVVLDPSEGIALDLAAQQLDDSIDYPIQRLRPSVDATLDQLQLMTAWPVAGSIEYRLLQFNPGFSLVVIDPADRRGTVIVEFHAFHNESTASRMHLELTRSDSARWYAYWTAQFDHIWSAARPATPASHRHTPPGDA
jgi:hypothetical protein